MQNGVEHLLSFSDVQVSDKLSNLIFNPRSATRRNFERSEWGVVSVGQFVIGQVFISGRLFLTVSPLYGPDVGNGLLSPQHRIFKTSDAHPNLELFGMLSLDVIAVALRPCLNAARERARDLSCPSVFFEGYLLDFASERRHFFA